MKKNLILLSGAALLFSSLFAFAADEAREIKMEVKKEGDKTVWAPQKVEVHPGEKVKFVVEDKLPGKEFHTFTISRLKVNEKIDFDKPAKDVEVTIPKSMKPGEEIKIACAAHPTHVPATLVIAPAPTTAKK